MFLFLLQNLIFSDNGIDFGLVTYPVCLPISSNEDPNKWDKRKVEVLGYATQDFSNTRGDIMRAAEMDVFTQPKCNEKLEKKLQDNKDCKCITKKIFNARNFRNKYRIIQILIKN